MKTADELRIAINNALDVMPENPVLTLCDECAIAGFRLALSTARMGDLRRPHAQLNALDAIAAELVDNRRCDAGGK
jgi:hypothetical protein